MKHSCNGKLIIESGALEVGRGRGYDFKSPHPPKSLKPKFKKQHFCRHDNIKRFM